MLEICTNFACTGIALLYKGGDGATLSLAGVLLVFLSALAYAIYIVGVNRSALRRLPTEGERLEAGPLSILPKSRETFLDGRRVELTAREYELLLYLARRAGSTVTRGELLREVWGYATEEDPSRTVDAHVKTLRLKLGDTAAEPRLIRTVRGAGYRLIAGEEA